MTETTGNNTTNGATTAFVQQELTAAAIPSVNAIPNTIVTSTSYMTYQFMPTTNATTNVVSNGWVESDAVLAADQ